MRSMKLSLAVAVFIYYIFGFIAWDWNPATWTEGLRAGAALGWLTVFAMWLAIELELV